MARPPKDAPGALDRAREMVRSAVDADGLRVAQAALLPLLGLSLEMTAEIVGRDRWWVSRARNRFLRGDPPLKHGGRRASLVSEDEELELVKKAVMTSDRVWGRRHTVRLRLQELLDLASGHPTADSTVSDMLNRVAPKVIRGATGTHLVQGADHLAWLWSLEASLSMAEKSQPT